MPELCSYAFVASNLSHNIYVVIIVQPFPAPAVYKAVFVVARYCFYYVLPYIISRIRCRYITVGCKLRPAKYNIKRLLSVFVCWAYINQVVS